MALILHLETASTVCSVALANHGEIIAVKEEDKGFTHAENLTVFIEKLMEMNGKSLAELDAIAVSKGPGSYTGLRIGVATAKGLCFGLNKPLLAVNTLASLVEGARMKQQPVDFYCPMLDARRMEVYTSLYDSNGAEVQPTAALILDATSYNVELKASKILFFGDGAAKFKSLCEHEHAFFDETVKPSASFMITLAYQKFKKQEFENIAYFEPYYLKEFYTPPAKPKF